MEIFFILVFFAEIFLMGFTEGFKQRSKRENVFYALCITVSLTVLLLKSMPLELPDPIHALVNLIKDKI